VSSLSESARAIAEAWERRAPGGQPRPERQAMHELVDLAEPPRPASGRGGRSSPDERDLLVGWMRDFAHEARAPGGERAAELVDEQMSRAGLHVWDDGGTVSSVGNAIEVGGVIRIGPVYTPPPLRGRGYASSAVAAVSRLALQRDLRCVLFTDLDNPTSNRIYADVGYRRIADWEEREFEVSGAPGR
jgi:RimJ/RimL family protein N-acetyltransferase